MDNKTIGILGEKFAQQVLIDKGYKIVSENYHSRFGEIDIIATNTDFIVFVEVKTRTENSKGTPAEAVTNRKQLKLIKTAMSFLMNNNFEIQPRFDVIEILIKKSDVFLVKEYNHIENAFFVENTYEIF